MPIDKFPALLSTSKRICDVISNQLFKQQKLVQEAKTKKSKMIRFLAVLSTLYYQILRVPRRKLKKRRNEEQYGSWGGGGGGGN